jgi:LPXTG-motif cell wall-anchored protein
MPATGNLIIHKYLFDEDDMFIGEDPGAVERRGPSNDGTRSAYADGIGDNWKLNGIIFNLYKVNVPTNSDGNVIGMPISADPDNPRAATYVQAVSVKAGVTNPSLNPVNPDDWVINVVNPTHVITNGIAYTVSPADPASVTTATDDDLGMGIARANNLSRGFYLVIEAPDSRVISPIDPFLVSVPMTNVTGDGWLTDVHVYPKNEDLGVHKVVDRSVVETGHKVTWTVITGIPSDIGAFTKFNMFDILDHALTYVPGSMQVTTVTTVEPLPVLGGTPVAESGNWSVSVKDGVALDIKSRDAFDADDYDNVLFVEFTQAGRELLQDRFELIPRQRYVQFRFETIVDAKHVDDVNRTLDNFASVEFTNRYGEDKDRSTKPDPYVHTAAIVIEKHDSKNANDGQAMNGAQFKIAESAEYAKAGKYIRKAIDGTILYVDETPGSAWLAAAGRDWQKAGDASGDWLVTVNNGTATVPAHAIFAGLVDYDETYYTDNDITKHVEDRVYRKYWLVETKAPAGYNLLQEPIMVDFANLTVSGPDGTRTGESRYGFGSAYTIYAKVANTKVFILPLTGVMGTVLVTAGGVVLIAFAAYLLVVGKRKKEALDQA